MDPARPLSLSLRTGAASLPDAAPAIDAFTAGARTPDREATDPMVWLLASEPNPAVGGLSVLERTARLPTPEEFHAALAGRDTTPWSLSRRWRGRTFAALAISAPLVLAPATGFAGSHDEDSAEVEGSEAPGDEAVEADPAPAPTEDLSWTGRVIWDSLQGAEVDVTLWDGTQLSGLLVGQADTEIALATDPDGAVTRIPKEVVARVRVVAMPWEQEGELIREVLREYDLGGESSDDSKKKKEPPRGEGLAIAGTSMTITGASMMMIFGLAHLANSSFFYYGGPLMVIGPSLLGPGIPMMAQGFSQIEKRKEWELAQEVQIGMGPTQGGWAGSVQIRW